MLKSSKQFRDLFQFKDGEIHFNNAGVAPMFCSTTKTVKDLIDSSCDRGIHNFESVMESYEKSRKQIARLLKTSVDSVALTQNCATALSMVAYGLPLNAGENIVTWENEYSSNAYVWHRVCGKKNVEVRRAPWESSGELDLQKLLDQIDNKTTAVVFSWYQSQTGYETPLAPVIDKAKSLGAWVIVDIIQGAGIAPFDFEQYPIDIACFGAHKWLCGPLGSGVLAFKDNCYKKLEVLLEGGMSYGFPQEYFDLEVELVESARRFEPGGSLIWTSVACGQSCEELDKFGLDSIYRIAMQHRGALVSLVESLGGTVVGSKTGENSNPSVLFNIPRVDNVLLMDRLGEEKISCSLKKLGLRLSPHAFNTKKEVQFAQQVIADFAERRV